MAEKKNQVVQGKFGKINSLKKMTLLFEKLSISQLQGELTSRKVELKHLKSTLKDLAPVLKKELRGVKRLPILLLNNPGLAKYEITLVECMHDIAHHIDNILVECMHDIAHHIDNILVECMHDIAHHIDNILVECMHDIAHHIDNILVECMHDIAHHIDNILVECNARYSTPH